MNDEKKAICKNVLKWRISDATQVGNKDSRENSKVRLKCTNSVSGSLYKPLRSCACLHVYRHPEDFGFPGEKVDTGETQTYLMVYRRVPLSTRRSSLLGVVILWATDFFPLWKKVSGVQILLASRLFKGSIFMGPSNFSLSSLQDCRKKTSIVYSFVEKGEKNKSCFTQQFIANKLLKRW